MTNNRDNEWDPVLLPLLQAADEEETDRYIHELIADPEKSEELKVIKIIVKRRLPYWKKIDHEDSVQEVCLRLVRGLRTVKPNQRPIRNFRNYVAAVTYRVLCDVDESNDEWRRLKEKLRYFHNHASDFAVWESLDGESLCGFAGWKHREDKFQTDENRLAQVLDAPAVIWPPELKRRDIRLLKREDWTMLLDSAYKYVEAPIALNILVNVVAKLFGIEGDPPPPPPPPPPLPPIFLRQIWEKIMQLKPLQRIAYLLNFTDGEGALWLFTDNGIATKSEIGQIVQLSDEQFARVWPELSLKGEDRRKLETATSYDAKFALLWEYLPLEDLVIAKLLNTNRQHIITLRKRARDSLAKQLR